MIYTVKAEYTGSLEFEVEVDDKNSNSYIKALEKSLEIAVEEFNETPYDFLFFNLEKED